MRGDFAGAVLAGGESRRMGRDKARLRVGGELLWRRQVRVLREAGAAPVVVVRRAGQRALAKDVPHVRDAVAKAGPLAGLQAALRATGAPWLMVLAVDMPAVDADWFRRLSKLCQAGAGVIARHGAGFEPLAAIYPREALAVVESRLRRGPKSLQETAWALVHGGRLKVVTLSMNEFWRMQNWNSEADLTGDLTAGT